MTINNITKNSAISISVVISMLILTFWLGFSYSNISTRVDLIEKQLEKIEIKVDEIHDKL